MHPPHIHGISWNHVLAFVFDSSPKPRVFHKVSRLIRRERRVAGHGHHGRGRVEHLAARVRQGKLDVE